MLNLGERTKQLIILGESEVNNEREEFQETKEKSREEVNVKIIGKGSNMDHGRIRIGWKRHVAASEK